MLDTLALERTHTASADAIRIPESPVKVVTALANSPDSAMPASSSTCFCCRRIILPGEPVWMDGFFEETWHEGCAGLARLLDPDGGERRQPVPFVAP